jgi:hypothetical protein
VQLHDICDEEVEEYFRQKLQLPAFVSLENDELLFWKKLGYHLYTNDADPETVTPVQKDTGKTKEKPVLQPKFYLRYVDAEKGDSAKKNDVINDVQLVREETKKQHKPKRKHRESKDGKFLLDEVSYPNNNLNAAFDTKLSTTFYNYDYQDKKIKIDQEEIQRTLMPSQDNKSSRKQSLPEAKKERKERDVEVPEKESKKLLRSPSSSSFRSSTASTPELNKNINTVSEKVDTKRFYSKTNKDLMSDSSDNLY